ncbi:MAG: RIP metalloprotease RseP [Candidatus Marinimicrobia bacterium]|nr:RIP metalloprotease RseP [Candidatus Neomarinimicrobiota bacterium]
MTTILGIAVVLGGVIFAHELGHFIFAKLTGMRVETFSIGFPPKIIKKKIGETEYCLSAIPLGGYVKVTGVIDESLDVEGATNAKDDPKSFASRKTWQKALFITGGVIFNFILAWFIFSFLTLASGITEAEKGTELGEVVADFPAWKAGIRTGDKILSVNNTDVSSWEEMTAIIHQFPKDTILVKWERNEGIFEQKIPTIANKILEDGKFKDVGMIGISPIFTQRKAGLLEAFGAGLANTFYWLKITFVSLKAVITGAESVKNLGGPIMIAQLAGESARSGLATLLGFMAIISVNLGFVNLLPIPALDGGHLIVILIEGILRRPLSDNTKIRIQQVGLAIILMITVLVLFNDISRWFAG